MVAAGKKAAETKRNASWTVEGHLKDKPQPIVQLFEQVREHMVSLDPTIEEAPKKLYVAYRTTQNIVCVEIQRQKVILYIRRSDAGVEVQGE